MTLFHSNLHKTTLIMHIENEYALTKLKEKHNKILHIETQFLNHYFSNKNPKESRSVSG